MNLHVTQRASLILRCLVVSGSLRTLHREGMALQAEQVHLTDAQEARIGRSVWRVTTCTTFRFNGDVLVDERTLLIGVTLRANCISTG